MLFHSWLSVIFLHIMVASWLKTARKAVVRCDADKIKMELVEL